VGVLTVGVLTVGVLTVGVQHNYGLNQGSFDLELSTLPIKVCRYANQLKYFRFPQKEFIFVNKTQQLRRIWKLTLASAVTSPDDCVTDFSVELVADSCSKLLILPATLDMAPIIFARRAILSALASSLSLDAS